MNRVRPAVVFDCNVYLQALARTTGPAAEALRRVERNEITLYLSRAILQELRAVLAYPEVRRKNPQITDALVDAYIRHIHFRSVWIRNVPRRVEFTRDPNDQPYLDLAAEADADFLVTRDNDLLDLVKDFSAESKAFRQRCPTLKIVDPATFLAQLGPSP